MAGKGNEDFQKMRNSLPKPVVILVLLALVVLAMGQLVAFLLDFGSFFEFIPRNLP